MSCINILNRSETESESVSETTFPTFKEEQRPRGKWENDLHAMCEFSLFRSRFHTSAVSFAAARSKLNGARMWAWQIGNT